MRSRLKTNLKKQNTKTIIGIIAIIIVVIVFGMKFLIGYSVILEKLKGAKENEENKQSVDYIAPPILNPVPQASKNSRITISGYVQSDNTEIKLYVNNSQVDKINSKPDNTFSFIDVPLTDGKNDIKAQASTADGKTSDYSQTVNVSYLNKLPALDINFPHDGQTFKKDESPIKVIGKTDSNVKVTVNDFWTIAHDDGTFNYSYTLKDGDNILKFLGQDEAGNKTEKEIKIKVE